MGLFSFFKKLSATPTPSPSAKTTTETKNWRYYGDIQHRLPTCACNCNYSCTCNCNYTCTCQCNYSGSGWWCSAHNNQHKGCTAHNSTQNDSTYTYSGAWVYNKDKKEFNPFKTWNKSDTDDPNREILLNPNNLWDYSNNNPSNPLVINTTGSFKPNRYEFLRKGINNTLQKLSQIYKANGNPASEKKSAKGFEYYCWMHRNGEPGTRNFICVGHKAPEWKFKEDMSNIKDIFGEGGDDYPKSNITS